MTLSASAIPFIPSTTSSPPTSEPTSPRGLESGPGYKLMLKMGWVPDTPLGIRGKGITKPVEVSFRHDMDHRGLGFETLHTDEEEVEKVSMKITNVGKNYGTAASDYGKVYVPMGALRHIGNISKVHVKELPDIHVSATITKADDKIKWRLNKVTNILGQLYLIAPNFVWGKSYIQ
tara:strand:- start:262 stop:789 length:528 start_codon:yes stop_codon:yes gene_type:complete